VNEWIHTTILSDLSSYSSLPSPSGLSSSPLMNVPLEPLTSLMKIYAQTMNITYFVKGVVAMHLGVLLPDLSMLLTQALGVEITIVLSGDSALVCLPILTRRLLVRLMRFTKESALPGYKGMWLVVVGAEKSGVGSGCCRCDKSSGMSTLRLGLHVRLGCLIAAASLTLVLCLQC
jgi:hypothetical protein